MLGETVLVAPVVTQGATNRDVYLPVNDGGWYEWKPDADDKAHWYSGGEVVTVNAPLGSLPVFIRAGAILPIATQWDQSRPHDAKEITLIYFALPQAGNSELEIFYDDGLTWEYQNQQGANMHVIAESSATSVSLKSNERWQMQPTDSQSSVNWLHSIVGLGSRTLIS